MDKDAVNRVVAAILANGLMDKNDWTKDSETYMRVYKGFLHDLGEVDKQAAKAATDGYMEALKGLADS